MKRLLVPESHLFLFKTNLHELSGISCKLITIIMESEEEKENSLKIKL